MIGLRGKRALVTGGSRGIGAATAELFAEYGVDVAIGYRSRHADADALVAELRERLGVKVVAHASDISTRAGADELVDRAADALGGLDFFVGNAGIWPSRRRRARRHDRRAVAPDDGGERRLGVLDDARGDSPNVRRRPHRARVEHGGPARRSVSRRLRGVEGRDDLAREVARAGAWASAASR